MSPGKPYWRRCRRLKWSLGHWNCRHTVSAARPPGCCAAHRWTEAITRFLVLWAVIYSNPVDVMPERTYGTERYSAGQWEDRNRRVEVSGSAPQIPSGPNGPWDLDPPAPALNTSMPREDKAFAAQRVQAPRHLGRSRGQIGSTDLFRTKSVARTSGWACAISGG